MSCSGQWPRRTVWLRGIRSLIEQPQLCRQRGQLWELINKKGKARRPRRRSCRLVERVCGAAPNPRDCRSTPAHVLYLDRLPWIHRDPYDRILIAQSAVEKMVLVTADETIRRYPVEILKPRS